MNKTKKDNLNWPMTEVKNIDISKDMLSYIITCRDRYPFFSDEILQKWVEEKVRYAQQVLREGKAEERR